MTDIVRTNKVLTLEGFYDQHHLNYPRGAKNELGHFNVFQRNNQSGPKADDIPFCRKDFYKICLLTGKNKIYFGDQTFQTDKNALLFINPHTPYGLEIMDKEQSGFFCLFSGSFFINSPSPVNRFALFEKSSRPLLNLSDQQFEAISGIYLRMQQENSHNFKFKNELLHNLILELAFSALKIVPEKKFSVTGDEKTIPALFFELLETQFPIESSGHIIPLRSPAAFADKLSVHVNYLNRSLKAAYGKTTSQLITERLIQEAKRLLVRTSWNISEIAWRLGYDELPHFNMVFKKNTHMTPKAFRIIWQA